MEDMFEQLMSAETEEEALEAEKNFSDLHFDSEKKKQKIRSSLYDGYEQTNNLQKGWQDRRKVYRISYLIDSMKVASSWDKKKRQETGLTEQRLRKELEKRIDKL